MIGLATYAATKRSFIGVDWMNLTSGALKTAGGAFGGGGGDAAATAAIEKMRLEEAKKAAEERAATWKWVGIGGAAVVAVLLFRHKAAA